MTGSEWVVEAFGCDAARLGSIGALRGLFHAMIAELALHPVGDAIWHRFPEPGGITGMQMLAESHITVHTFPEHESLCLNVFCCTPRAEWAFQERLHALVGATDVRVVTLVRDYGAAAGDAVRYARVAAS